MQVKIEKLPKSTLQLEITVPAEKVEQAKKETIEELAKTTELKGFRKGNAPIDLVEKSLDPTKLNSEVINHLLEKYYVEALKENKVAPISHPKIELKAFGEYKDFVFVAKVAIRPDVKMGDYKKAIKKAAEEKKEDARKQKEAALKEGKPLEHVHDHLHTPEIIDLIADSAEMEVPEILVEEEIDRYMARLVDQIQALGMQMSEYLKAQNKTAEKVREEFSAMAEKNLKAEFAMAEAIKSAGIEVTDAEIEETAKATGDPQALENVKDPMTRAYIKSILEKNKLLAGIMEEMGDLAVDHSVGDGKNAKKDSSDEAEEKKEEK